MRRNRKSYNERWGHERTKIQRGKAIRKAQKREEAEARAARWNSLTATQKLAELAKRRGQSARQIARLKA